MKKYKIECPYCKDTFKKKGIITSKRNIYNDEPNSTFIMFTRCRKCGRRTEYRLGYLREKYDE